MTELPGKVRMLYQAMQELICEGVDLTATKVSVITDRAGIGKGTAYEYFTSKEDLIASSLAFFVQETMEELSIAIQDKSTLSEQLDSLLKEIGEKVRARAGLLHFVNMLTGSSPISLLFRDKLLLESNDSFRPIQLIAGMIEQAMARGEIQAHFPMDYMILAICSRIITYITFLTIREELEQVGLQLMRAQDRGEDEMREYICQGILREFR
ncbi:MAG: TetR/AcrR family transcriptional regulator [Lachnospiraceae bacterium]|jgi:AcrR family transcriptional regulator|nr:TetR/AcrR family transcriptional regulator [Lachnospiraceae bacterium]